MMRHCDGNDPTLVTESLNIETDSYEWLPCKCGLAFDDVTNSVIFPHVRLLTRVEKEAILNLYRDYRDDQNG